MSYEVVFTDELYHHGIKGQKWGIRKYQNADGSLTAAGKARYNLKEAKRDYKKTLKRARNGFGIKGIEKSTKARKELEGKRLKYIDAKAKKAALKSEKKEFNTYVKEFRKTGLKGSAADEWSKGYGKEGKSTSLYKHLKAKKGKAYADKVEKKVQGKLIRDIAVGTTVSVGSLAASYYLSKKAQ